MSESKQVIVMRKDLNMRKGKMVAQGAHASMKAVLINQSKPTEALTHWLNEAFAKICVYVNSEEELLDLYVKCQARGIIHGLILDSGKTEFSGVPTYTALAIGPAWVHEFEGLTDMLPLL